MQRIREYLIVGVVLSVFFWSLLTGLHWVVDTLYAQTPPTCEDQRDDLLVQAASWQSAVGQLNKENRALRTKLAELEKAHAKVIPGIPVQP